MKKPPVGAGTFYPLSILIFYILLCWKYLPVSEAGPSPWCYRKIPEDPQIKNVRKNCRRFTAWGGKVQDLDIFSKVRNISGSLVYSLYIPSGFWPRVRARALHVPVFWAHCRAKQGAARPPAIAAASKIFPLDH